MKTLHPSNVLRARKQRPSNARSGRGLPDSSKPGTALDLRGANLLSAVAWEEVSRSLALSPRQLAVVQGVFDNLCEKSMAFDLGLSQHTVHMHLNRLYQKLGVTTRVELVICVMAELHHLTRCGDSTLPPICRNRAGGTCPLAVSDGPPGAHGLKQERQPVSGHALAGKTGEPQCPVGV